jgi:hypothetical protein
VSRWPVAGLSGIWFLASRPASRSSSPVSNNKHSTNTDTWYRETKMLILKHLKTLQHVSIIIQITISNYKIPRRCKNFCSCTTDNILLQVHNCEEGQKRVTTVDCCGRLKSVQDKKHRMATECEVKRIFRFSCALRTALPLLLTNDL